MPKCARSAASDGVVNILVGEKKGPGLPELKFEWQTNPVRIGPRPLLALAARGGLPPDLFRSKSQPFG